MLPDLSESVIEDVIGGEQIEQIGDEQTEIEQIDQQAETLLAKYAQTSQKNKCPKCDYLTSNTSHFKRHILTHNKPPRTRKTYKCSECNYTSLEWGNFDRHMQIHNGTQKYVCGECQKKFTTASLLRQHELIHGNKNFKCSDCQAEFSQKSKLERHLKTHQEQKQYKCYLEWCNYECHQSNDLNTHMQYHLNQRMYVCNWGGECEAAFLTKQNLQLHIKYHKQEKNFKCTFQGCDCAFVAKDHLTRHLKTHRQQKQYKCYLEWCKFQCHQSEDLNTHMQTHLGLKKFVCDFDGCEAAFVTNGELKVHIAYHKNDKKYKCTFQGCDCAFVKKQHLCNHLKTHTGEKPHKCEEENCGYASITSSDLKAHFARNHSKEGIQQRKKQEERINRCLLEAGFSKFDEGGDFHPPLKHFKREYYIDFACIDDNSGRNAWVDFVIGVNGGIVMLELDENQHKDKGYSCNLSQMAKVHETLTLAGSDIPIFWIRYNPNAFRVDGVLQKCKKVDRERWLIDFLNKLDLRDSPPMTICYKYYDEENGMPVVTQEQNYPFKHSLFQE